MADPLAYLLSWTTKGTWLPGDKRGWVRSGVPGIQKPDPVRREQAKYRLRADPIVLNPEQRLLVERVITKHCDLRGWTLHAVNPRTNHVHFVVTADRTPEDVMEQFKAWCSRRLNEQANVKKKWWTEHGSTRWLNTEPSVVAAIDYVLNGQ